MNLVTPPSAIASITMSAWYKPLCGRASGLFSIIMPVIGLAAIAADATSLPVRGDVGGWFGAGSSWVMLFWVVG